MSRRFREAMRLMRKRDAQAREDGFHTLLPHAGEHVDELIAELRAETQDHGLRCWLLELIGEAQSSAAMPILVEHLDSDDESLRSWARRGLEELDTREARTALSTPREGDRR